MSKHTETHSSEYQNFDFKEPEPTADELAQYGFTTREQWFTARHEQFGSYEEQKQEAFREHKENQRLDELAKSFGAEGQKKQAAAQEEEHRENIAKRNSKRTREMEKFRSRIERKANALMPYIQGAQKWIKKPAMPVDATADEMAAYVKTLRAFEKTEATMGEKAANLCGALGIIFADMKTWPQDLKTKDTMMPLTQAVALLKAAVPVELKGESFEQLRAQIAAYEQAVLYTDDEFQVAPFFIYPRPGQPVPYNYIVVPENSDCIEMWQNKSRTE